MSGGAAQRGARSAYWDYEDGSKTVFDEEIAASILLDEGVLFVAGGYGSKSDTLELVVNCNDLFWWGTADAEPCKPGELQSLYNAWKADKRWGVSIWCCKHRGLQPQRPVREKMQEAGVWTEELAGLADPGPWPRAAGGRDADLEALMETDMVSLPPGVRMGDIAKKRDEAIRLCREARDRAEAADAEAARLAAEAAALRGETVRWHEAARDVLDEVLGWPHGPADPVKRKPYDEAINTLAEMVRAAEKRESAR